MQWMFGLIYELLECGMKAIEISILLVDFNSPTNRISSSGPHFRLLVGLFFFAHTLYTAFFSLLNILVIAWAILQTLGHIILSLSVLSLVLGKFKDHLAFFLWLGRI